MRQLSRNAHRPSNVCREAEGQVFGHPPEYIETVKQSILLSSDQSSALYGKTGTGRIDGKDVSGWFIGFAETEDDVYFFAANLQSEDGASGSAAAEIVLKILTDKGIVLRS